MKKLMLISLLLLMLCPVFGAVQTFGTFKQNTCINLIQTCGNCSYVNISSIKYPDSELQILNAEMTQQGTTYNYTFCNTTQLGNYIANTEGDGIPSPYDFEVTPSGFEISSGHSINIFGSLLLIIILGAAFFFIAHKSISTVAKISFYTFSVIILVVSILYTIIIMQQTLFGFENILIGIESFWFVVKIGLGIGVLALGIVIFLVMLKAWKIKRGLYDID